MREYILTRKGVAALGVLSKNEKLREEDLDFYDLLREVESTNEVSKGIDKSLVGFALGQDYIEGWVR